jgi:hypothetical protein
MAQQNIEYISLRKRFLRKSWHLIKIILNYPFEVKNRYAYENAILTQMMKNMKKVDPKDLKDLRAKNITLVNLSIFLPMFMGLMLNIMYIGMNPSVKNRYNVYLQRLTLPIKSEGVFRKTFAFMERVVKAVYHQPVKFSDFQFTIYGYGLAIGGALFLSANPAFRRAEEIQEVLLKMNKVDGEKNPWRVLWTPNYIFFEAYGCNPHAFVDEVKFWNTINYPPAEPIIFDEQMSKFIVPRKYQLPSKIEFKYRASSTPV